MNKEVQMGQIEVGKNEDDLTASGIGSCVVVALYDPKRKIGALAHSMLPSRNSELRTHNSELRTHNSELRTHNSELKDTRYIDVAIDQMLKKMQELGVRKQDIEAKLIGGANMFAVSGFSEDSIGKKNITSARGSLRSYGIPIVGECVGGSQGRSVEFSVASGVITVKTKF